MSVLYLAGLLVGIAGMVAIDARWRLFLFAAPLKALAVLAVGVLGFLLWDSAGIRSGIFFEGDRRLLLGLDLAPQLPVEEVLFLVLLCLTTMEAFTLLLRGRRRAPRP